MNEAERSPPRRRGFAPSSARRTDLRAIVWALLLALLVWQALDIVSGGWVPSIPEIGVAFVERLTMAETYQAIVTTLRRIAVAFGGAFVVGVALGIAIGLWDWVDAFWRPIIAMALAIPDPVYFIMAILVLGPGELESLLALTLAVLPFAISAVSSGVGARDPNLDEMARAYRMTGWRYTRDVLLPQIAPALVVSARTAFAFSWKIGVLMEALTQSDGVGAQIFFAFRLFKADHMIALAIIFIVVMRAIENLLFKPLERRATAWRE